MRMCTGATGLQRSCTPERAGGWLAQRRHQTGSEGKGSGQVHEERKASHKQKARVPGVGSWGKLVVCGVCTILRVCHSAPLPYPFL